MLSTRRFFLCLLLTLFVIHSLLSLSHEEYGRATSLDNIKQHWKNSHPNDHPPLTNTSTTDDSSLPSTNVISTDPSADATTPPPALPIDTRANATFVFLCRNKDLNGVVASVQQMEDRFNKKFLYPWVFLNDEPFTEDFKRRIRILTDAPIHFGLIPPTHWYQPDWIDETKARENRRRMKQKGIIYADSVSYRNMCRYNSGFFYHHELLKPYRYYWRPDVKFFCDLNYDPFKFMEENNKVYAFTISLLEWGATISSLWKAVAEFTAANPQYLAEDNALGFISDNRGLTYNLCHFWSNFEIADMEFWRSEAYEEFFEHLESKGGFYYERWGDAPIHSIAAALFARKDQIHFFSDIGYKHEWFQHCPQGEEWERGKCSCDPNNNFDWAKNSCLNKFTNLFDESS